MTVSGDKIKRGRTQLAVAALLVASACTPLPHREGTVGGGSAALIERGDQARDAGDPAAALPLYQRAHRIDPDANSVTTVRIAQTLNQLGAYHDAGDAWASVLRSEPNNFDALVGYGITLTALDQPLLALEYFERAQQVGESAALFNGMGVSHDMVGRPVQAQEAYRRGLELAPNNIRLANNLGLSLALSGSFNAAISRLEAVSQMPSAGIRHRQNLALAYALAGFGERARTLSYQDLDDLSVQRNMSFYRVLAGMRDHAQKVAALGAFTDGRLPADAVPLQDAAFLR